MSRPSADPRTSLVKGAAMREFLDWLEAQHGRAYVAHVQRGLRPENLQLVWPDRPALGLVSNEWYPSTLVHELLDAVFENLDEAEAERLMRDGNRAMVRRLTRGVYQFLFRMVASPSLYAKYVQKAWNQMHTTGVRKVVLFPGRAESTTLDWTGHHPRLCAFTTETMRAVFEAMGCTDTRIERVRCVASGSHDCHAILHYRE